MDWLANWLTLFYFISWIDWLIQSDWLTLFHVISFHFIS